jgi:hypothetical protein
MTVDEYLDIERRYEWRAWGSRRSSKRSKGMRNKQLADLILQEPEEQVLTIGESAEPKSIDDIKSYRLKIIGAEKGQSQSALHPSDARPGILPAFSAART